MEAVTSDSQDSDPPLLIIFLYFPLQETEKNQNLFSLLKLQTLEPNYFRGIGRDGALTGCQNVR